MSTTSKSKTLGERIQKIAEKWFLGEPALFEMYCTHKVQENPGMECYARAGRGLLEINPGMLQQMPDSFVEDVLRIEVIRIFLKHPYERQPINVSNIAKTMGSDCTISNYYYAIDSLKRMQLTTPEDFDLPKNEYFEWYAHEIERKIQNENSQSKAPSPDDSEQTTDEQQQNDSQSPQQSGIGENGQSPLGNMQAKSEISATWEEDEMRSQEINETISRITGWGSIPGDLVEQIKASTRAKIDYRKILQGFRASILSSRRSLTRMRPNRRTGFQNMGSIYRFSTSILVAVDVSGSVSDRTLSDFYSVINNAFKYGIERIDVMQFDYVAGDIVEFRKRQTKVEVKGRGGTNFQSVVDRAASHLPTYDGLIILTDGYAPVPKLPVGFSTKILWVLQDERSYECQAEKLSATGRVCVMNLSK